MWIPAVNQYVFWIMTCLFICRYGQGEHVRSLFKCYFWLIWLWKTKKATEIRCMVFIPRIAECEPSATTAFSQPLCRPQKHHLNSIAEKRSCVWLSLRLLANVSSTAITEMSVLCFRWIAQCLEEYAAKKTPVELQTVPEVCGPSHAEHQIFPDEAMPLCWGGKVVGCPLPLSGGLVEFWLPQGSAQDPSGPIRTHLTPGHSLLELLSSGRRFRAVKARRKKRLKKSFHSRAITAVNSEEPDMQKGAWSVQ